MADDAIPHTHRSRRSDRPPPDSRTARFVALVRDVHGDGFVASWLLSSTIKMPDGSAGFQNCEFTDDTVWTTNIGLQRLTSACSGLAEKADITIRECPQIRARFHAWARQQRKTGGNR